MRVGLLMLIVTTLVCCKSDGPRKVTENNCKGQLIIAVKEKPQRFRGNPTLVVTLVNQSKTALFGYNALQLSSHPYRGLACTVISPDGENLSLPRDTIRGGSGNFLVVSAQNSESFDFDIYKLCKFEKPGTYKITALKRMYWHLTNRCDLVSNTLLLNLTAEDIRTKESEERTSF